MDSLNVRFPKNLLVFFGSKDKLEEEALKAVVMQLIRDHKISQGKGAELLGMNRWDFYNLLAQNNIPTIDITTEELDEENEVFKNLQELN